MRLLPSPTSTLLVTSSKLVVTEGGHQASFSPILVSGHHLSLHHLPHACLSSYRLWVLGKCLVPRSFRILLHKTWESWKNLVRWDLQSSWNTEGTQRTQVYFPLPSPSYLCPLRFSIWWFPFPTLICPTRPFLPHPTQMCSSTSFR